jgi:hypothetical protein
MFPGDPTAKPALVYNCFVGETQIATDSDIIRSIRHDYSGDLVEVETAGGVHFTCTPNHPILRSVGWVPAALLNNGYNLLVANVRNEFGLRRNGNIKHIHTRMKALFNALHYVGLMDRDATLRVDFHGDIPTTDVEVITKKWKLRGNRDSGCADGVNKLLFKDSNEPLVSKSAFVQHLGSVGFAAFRFIGSFGKTLAFFRRRLSHAVVHGFRTITGSNAAILQTQADDVAGNVQLIRECLDGFTGKVFVDNIVNIKITTVRHVPVYNLQTDTGHYFVSYIIPQNNAKCNGNYAIAKNCRCTLTYEYPDYPSTMPRRDAETGEIVADMTYREWERLKQRETTKKKVDTFTVAEGRDISDTWQRRPDQFDFEIEDVINAQGFDGKPRIVSAEEFDAAVKQSSFIAQRTYSAPDQETLDAYREQLYSGDWYVDCSNGGAMFGQGMYSVSRDGTEITQSMDKAIEGYKKGAQYTAVETFTLAPGAKVADYETIEDIVIREAQEHGLAKREDVGVRAAKMGYDAIKVPIRPGYDYTIVLNRTKVIFRRPD